MIDEALLETRLTALERAVTEVKKQLGREPAPDWIERISGAITDEAAFDEVLAYGRAFRREEANQPQTSDET